jgi:hypothetical protein
MSSFLQYEGKSLLCLYREEEQSKKRREEERRKKKNERKKERLNVRKIVLLINQSRKIQ